MFKFSENLGDIKDMLFVTTKQKDCSEKCKEALTDGWKLLQMYREGNVLGFVFVK